MGRLSWAVLEDLEACAVTSARRGRMFLSPFGLRAWPELGYQCENRVQAD